MTPACPQGPWPEEFPSFTPRAYLRNGHLQTIVGNLLPRSDDLPQPETQWVDVSPAWGAQRGSQVLCECHWQPFAERRERPTAILVHGLEGSSKSQYVIGNANKLWHAGCNVVRMNMRNCGGTEQRTPTLYHSGLSGDVGAVMRFFAEAYGLRSLSLIGYSMGGNLVLKLAGELGAEAPSFLHSVIGVSPVIDLAQSADALHEPANRVYEWRFVNGLLKRFRRKAALFPRAYNPALAMRVSSIRQFDEHITALYSGFASADDYYYRAAAARVIDRITVPTLLIHACDDPFIRMTDMTRASIAANPHLTLLETEHGGHCAFLSTPEPATGDDGYWAESTALRFVLAHA